MLAQKPRLLDAPAHGRIESTKRDAYHDYGPHVGYRWVVLDDRTLKTSHVPNALQCYAPLSSGQKREDSRTYEALACTSQRLHIARSFLRAVWLTSRARLPDTPDVKQLLISSSSNAADLPEELIRSEHLLLDFWNSRIDELSQAEKGESGMWLDLCNAFIDELSQAEGNLDMCPLARPRHACEIPLRQRDAGLDNMHVETEPSIPDALDNTTAEVPIRTRASRQNATRTPEPETGGHPSVPNNGTCPTDSSQYSTCTPIATEQPAQELPSHGDSLERRMDETLGLGEMPRG
jgi:hypothetical protein